MELSLPFFIPAGLGLLGSFGSITRFKSSLPNRYTYVQCTCCVVVFFISFSSWFSTNLRQTGCYPICGPEPLNSARRPQEVCPCHVRCIFTQNILDLYLFYLVVIVPQKESGTGSVGCWCPPAECCSTASNQTACMCQQIPYKTQNEQMQWCSFSIMM